MIYICTITKIKFSIIPWGAFSEVRGRCLMSCRTAVLITRKNWRILLTCCWDIFVCWERWEVQYPEQYSSKISNRYVRTNETAPNSVFTFCIVKSATVFPSVHWSKLPLYAFVVNSEHLCILTRLFLLLWRSEGGGRLWFLTMAKVICAENADPGRWREVIKIS